MQGGEAEMPKGRHGNHPKARRHYRWSRERIVSSHGYTKVRVGRHHPLADPNGYAYEQLLVWVSAGRPRPGKGEVLKFHNEDRSDCRLENLYVATRAEHNRRKNEQQMRDPQGRVMSSIATRAVRAGAVLRTVRIKP